MRSEPAPQADQERFDGVHVPVGRVEPGQPPPRQVRRQQHQKGQQSFVGRDGIAAKYAKRKRHGSAPTPAPYRPPARLEIEDLPEPPASAPLGAQASFGVPPLAPAGAPPYDAAALIEKLRARQEAAHG